MRFFGFHETSAQRFKIINIDTTAHTFHIESEQFPGAFLAASEDGAVAALSASAAAISYQFVRQGVPDADYADPAELTAEEDQQDDAVEMQRLEAQASEAARSRQAAEEAQLAAQKAELKSMRQAPLSHVVKGKWTPQLDGGYESLCNPQVLLEVASSGCVTLTLEREVSGGALIFFVYATSEMMIAPDTAIKKLTQSKYLSSDRVSHSFDFPAGKYVVLLCQQRPVPSGLTFTVDGGLVRLLPPPTILELTLPSRGPGAAGYGDSLNPQFFLTLSPPEDDATPKSSRVLITMVSSETGKEQFGSPLASRIFVRQGDAFSPAPCRIKEAVESDKCIAESAYLISQSVTVGVTLPNTKGGWYNILTCRSEAGLDETVTLRISTDDIGAELRGEAYVEPDTSNFYDAATELGSKQIIERPEGKRTLSKLYAWDDAKAIVDAVRSMCRENKTFFRDMTQFPPGPASNGTEHNAAQWMRARDLATQPRLIGKQVEPSDVRQGSLGDCWFCSALSVIATRPSLVTSIIYPTTYEPDIGIHCVKFFSGNDVFGIIIDDSLPCNAGGGPVFARSTESNELWVSFLEKAFAKALGSYVNMNGTFGMSVPLRVFTGGRPEAIFFSKNSPDQIFGKIKAGMDKSAIAATCTPDAAESMNSNGIVSGHAYGLLNAKEVGGFRLVQLRNTWARQEWSGDWCDASPLWEKHPEVAKACKVTPGKSSDDGWFWMSLEDYVKEFEYASVCYV
eukprot:PhM_4_TR15912/c0_g1_i2/m.77261